MLNGFDIRMENYDLIHDNTEQDWSNFMAAISPHENELILDGAGGYGAVTKHILERSNPLVYIVDNNVHQLSRLRKQKIVPDSNVFVSDIRGLPFLDNVFDTYALKMGVHEVPKLDQPKVFSEAYRILKKGGSFVVWELALDSDNQEIFQKIIRKKDSLSGFDSLVKNRYFPKHEETMKYFADAGFKDVKAVYTKIYYPDAYKRKNELVSKELSDYRWNNKSLSSDVEKKINELSLRRVDELNNYINSLVDLLPEEKKLFYSNNSGFFVEKKIYIAKK